MKDGETVCAHMNNPIDCASCRRIRNAQLPEPTCPECGSTVRCFHQPNSNSTFCVNEWHDGKE